MSLLKLSISTRNEDFKKVDIEALLPLTLMIIHDHNLRMIPE